MKTGNVKVLYLAALLGVGLASCSSSDTAAPVVKTDLITAIASATTLLATTVEGVGTGNYLKGSQAPLIEATTAASVVANDAAALQATVTNATVSLNAAIAAYGTQLVTPIDPANLAGQWTFDEVAGTTVAKDYSGNGRDGTLKASHSTTGSIMPVATADRYGIAGKALLFDKGANVEIPYNTALNSPAMSISAWVKLAEVRNNRFIGLQSWIGFKFEVQDGNRPFATIGVAGGAYDRDAAVAIPQAEWHHLVMTYTAGSMVFYIDGISVKTWTDTPLAAASISGKPYNLVLGQDFPTDKYSLDANGTNFDTIGHADYHVIPLAWGGYLHGSLDEVRIYKSVLTPAQVTSIYTIEKP